MVSDFLGELLGRRSANTADGSKGRIPDGERLYAIGDIHGRADLLQALHAKIKADDKGSGLRRTMVYLGDYIDRGLESRQVVDLLLAPVEAGVERHLLLGNHEAMLLDFLMGAGAMGAWLNNGGIETLHSYGVTPPRPNSGSDGMERARLALRARLPDDHLAFFQSLLLCHQRGDYYFVHGGVRPGVPLGQQIREDMIWIRNDFLDSREDFSKIIIHGHSIRNEVEERPNRIGIDTGAYISGTLTALVLEGDERRYLNTGG